MKRRIAIRTVVIGSAAAFLPLTQTRARRQIPVLPPASTLTLNIDDPRFEALQTIGGSVEISNLIVPGIQAVLPGGFPLALVRADAATVSALGKECPHNQCQVSSFNGDRFICPCHQSEFDASGTRLAGPASRGLDTFPAVLQESVVTVDGMSGDTRWNLTSVDHPRAVSSFELYPVYPQPVGSSMTVRWRQKTGVPVALMLLDVNGRVVHSLSDLPRIPGVYERAIDVSALPSGFYELLLHTGRAVEQRRIVITR